MLVMLTLVTLVTLGVIKQRQDLRQNATVGDVLSVNTAQNINPFSKQMLGMGMVNWEHAWGKPFPNEVPGLAQAMKEEGVGLIRYAGGLWANDVGFDRVNQRTPLLYQHLQTHQPQQEHLLLPELSRLRLL